MSAFDAAMQRITVALLFAIIIGGMMWLYYSAITGGTRWL
jgi:hypothetical protein